MTDFYFLFLFYRSELIPKQRPYLFATMGCLFGETHGLVQKLRSVLVEEKLGPCCDVLLFFGFCGVPVRVFGFPPVSGFGGFLFIVLFLFLLFFLFWCLFCIIPVCFGAFLRFL
jgi:hypothetical protein